MFNASQPVRLSQGGQKKKKQKQKKKNPANQQTNQQTNNSNNIKSKKKQSKTAPPSSPPPPSPSPSRDLTVSVLRRCCLSVYLRMTCHAWYCLSFASCFVNLFCCFSFCWIFLIFSFLLCATTPVLRLGKRNDSFLNWRQYDLKLK